MYSFDSSLSSMKLIILVDILFSESPDKDLIDLNVKKVLTVVKGVNDCILNKM